MTLLLVRPGSALPINYIVVGVFPREVSSATDTTEPSSSLNVGAIIGGAVAGVGLTVFFLVWYSGYRKRKNEPHTEEGGVRKEKSPGWFSNFRSEFSPDEKARRFDRFREAFSRRGEKKAQEGILPTYQAKPPLSHMDSISPPPRAVPNHVPRYPSALERGHSKTARYPPPTHDLSRMPSITESLRSAPAGDRASRRKVQIPPRALLVPPPGRPLPGLAGRIGMLRSPRSASRRKSWLSKRLSKHPFIPLRADSPLHFPPSSLNPDPYQPSRQHLEARLDSRSPMQITSKEFGKYSPVSVDVNKHAQIAAALQSSGARTPLTSRLASAGRTYF